MKVQKTQSLIVTSQHSSKLSSTLKLLTYFKFSTPTLRNICLGIDKYSHFIHLGTKGVQVINTNTQPAEKFIVIPYRKNRRNLTAAEMRPAQTEESAKRITDLMAERFAGVVAYAVVVDEKSGDMNEPRLLASYGDVPAAQED